jgi:hypothetical protein
MPGTTPNGYPYAEPTDPLVQWPATSQALAQAIDTKTADLNTLLQGRAIATAYLTTDANGDGSAFWPAGLFAAGIGPATQDLFVFAQIFYSGNIALAKSGYWVNIVSADNAGVVVSVGGKDATGAFVPAGLPVMLVAIGTPAG